MFFVFIKMLSKILKYLRLVFLNKYLIVLVGFGVFIIFFDSHNLIQRRKMDKKLQELQKEYEYYQNEIKNNKFIIRELQTNDAFLEKFAREKYLMKKENEEIFIIR